MKFEKSTPKAEILAHPNLPEYLEGFESTHGVLNGMGVIFTIYQVELPNGSPGLFWTAEVMTHPALLERHFPDHFEFEAVVKPVILVTVGAGSATELLEVLSGTVPRVVWHWIKPVIKSQDEQASTFLKGELEARFSETKGTVTELSWRLLK
jgi:hypothetical protein